MIDHGYGVTLGPLEEDCLEQMRKWRNNYAIWKTCRQNDLIDAPSQRRWFERTSEDPTIKMYLVHAKPGSELKPVGVCGLTSIDPFNRRAEFSLYIGPEFQGNGFGRAALKTLCTHGFVTLGLNVIWGESFEGNSAFEMFKDLGFKEEGIRRQFYYRGGRFIDAHLFSLIHEEWTKWSC